MTAAPAIEVHALHKSYGDMEAVGGIDFSVRRGEVFGLLGPNGAGKTTTVEILEGYRERTAGEVSGLGFDPAHRPRGMRERVGIVLQQTGIYPHIRVREALAHFAGMYPAPRDPDEVIALIGLQGKEDARARTLSGGQLRRLDLGLALIGDPELMFLDEPTTGFDPSARRQAWDTIAGLRGLGKTIFLTTHYMDEAQYLADRVAVIAAGQLVAQGNPESIGGRDSGAALIRFMLPGGLPVSALPVRARLDGDHVVIESSDPTRTLHLVTGWALERGVELRALTVSRPSLEDVYLEMVGR